MLTAHRWGVIVTGAALLLTAGLAVRSSRSGVDAPAKESKVEATSSEEHGNVLPVPGDTLELVIDTPGVDSAAKRRLLEKSLRLGDTVGIHQAGGILFRTGTSVFVLSAIDDWFEVRINSGTETYWIPECALLGTEILAHTDPPIALSDLMRAREEAVSRLFDKSKR